MKIRCDFVTNSSSSSFILGFMNEDEIYSVKDELPDYWSDEAKDGVVQDIMNGITTKDVIVGEMAYQDTLYRYYNLPKTRRTDGVWKTLEITSKQEIEKKLPNYNVYSHISYSDDTRFGNEMEHKIMPYLDCTIHRISNH